MALKRNNDLGAFFEARNVAVIGSFKEYWVGGYGVIKNLLNFGFSGNIYPVNPSCSNVLGMTAYPAVDQVPDAIDLAIVITPSPIVPTIIEQCGHKGIKAAIVVSDGFAEANGEGIKLQREIVDIARNSGTRLIGPNTIGIINSASGLVTTPYFTGYSSIQRGTITYVSQTGLAGAQALPLEDLAYPISKMCDFGNKCDVNELDIIDYLDGDPDTKVIAAHLEDIKDSHQFMNMARKVVANKPVLILKPGKSEASIRAMASHTGSLAGNDQIYDSAFKQAGIIRLDTWQEFLEIPRVFASQPLPTGNRIAIISLTGGAGIMAIDAAVTYGLAVSQLSSHTINKLTKISPRLATNPIDFGQVAAVITNFIPTFEPIVTTVLGDDNIDCITIILSAGLADEMTDAIDMFRRLKQQALKPITIWLCGPQLAVREELARELETIGLPTYSNLETAVKALGIAANYARIKSQFEY